MTFENKKLITANYTSKEYIILLKQEFFNMFTDEAHLRSIGAKSNCYIELTGRILKRKVNEFRFSTYIIIRIEGQSLRAIEQCNKLLERSFPQYKRRKDYQKHPRKPKPIGHIPATIKNKKSNIVWKNIIKDSHEPDQPYQKTYLQYQQPSQWRLADRNDILLSGRNFTSNGMLYFYGQSFLEQEGYRPKERTEILFDCNLHDLYVNYKGERKQKKYKKHHKFISSKLKRKEYIRCRKINRVTKKKFSEKQMFEEAFLILIMGINIEYYVIKKVVKWIMNEINEQVTDQSVLDDLISRMMDDAVLEEPFSISIAEMSSENSGKNSYSSSSSSSSSKSIEDSSKETDLELINNITFKTKVGSKFEDISKETDVNLLNNITYNSKVGCKSSEQGGICYSDDEFDAVLINPPSKSESNTTESERSQTSKIMDDSDKICCCYNKE